MSSHHHNRYLRFIESRRHRTIEGIVEVHHILPRALGGTDDDDNLIELSPREHFIAHWMLWKAYRNQPMADAFWLMKNTRDGNINSKTYQRLKEDRSKVISERMKRDNPSCRPEVKEMRRQFMLGRQHALGKKMPPRTPEHIENNRQAQLRRKVKSHPQQSDAVKVSNVERWKDPTFRSKTSAKMSENNARNVSIVAAGTPYRSQAEAVRALSTTAKILRRKIAHPDYEDYYRL